MALDPGSAAWLEQFPGLAGGAPAPTPDWGGTLEHGGPEGESIYRQNQPLGLNGQILTDSKGNRFQYSVGEYTGGADGWNNGGWKYLDDAAMAAQQQQRAAGPSNMYDFGRYGYTQDVAGLPTLASNVFDQGLNDPWLNQMYNTADKGSWYTGLGALTGELQNLGSLRLQGGSYDPTDPNGQLSDATYRDLARFMGIDANASDFRDQVNQRSNDYAMVKGMGGYNPNDPRQVNQILYQRQASGEWKPILNRAYHEREKGSWWDEGGKYIMVPLGVIGAGLAGVAMGAGTAGEAGAVAGAGAGEAGATGLAAGAAEGSSIGGGLYGAGTVGEGYLGGSGLIGSGAGLGYGGAAAPTLAGSGAGGLGAGLYGTTAGGITSLMGPGSYAAAYAPWYEKALNQLQDKTTREALQKMLKGLLGQQAPAGGGGGGGGLGGGVPGISSAALAQEAAWQRGMLGAGIRRRKHSSDDE